MNYTPLPEGLSSINESPVHRGVASHTLVTGLKGLVVVVLTVAAGLSTATLIRNAVTLQNKAEEQNQVAMCTGQGGVVWDGQTCPDGAQEVNKIVTQIAASSQDATSPSDGTVTVPQDGTASGDGISSSLQPATRVQLCCKLHTTLPTTSKEDTTPVEPTPSPSVSEPAPTEAERCELPGITTILSCPEGCSSTR
ncbi:MAG: hypothetical protein UZ21_OP11001000411 [Microgenomates bacterium OLB22]|nr:MAG: hypothetical protein UZ21_OP11001000411 [Microgenomates bacterium OLB22]